MALLVLDEQLANPRLVAALRDRGSMAETVGDYGATGRADPDVVRRIAAQCRVPWVFVTMDLTIIEDFPGFDWNRYAIAWIRPREDLHGARVEEEKTDIIHGTRTQSVSNTPAIITHTQRPGISSTPELGDHPATLGSRAVVGSRSVDPHVWQTSRSRCVSPAGRADEPRQDCQRPLDSRARRADDGQHQPSGPARLAPPGPWPVPNRGGPACLIVIRSSSTPRPGT